MAKDTYSSGGSAYPITVYPAPADGKKRSVILLVHGNFGLGSPYGEQIQSFARDLAGLGYLTAVPQYYLDGKPHPTDTVPKDRALADAVAAVTGRADAAADQIGLIGFSLGATTVTTRWGKWFQGGWSNWESLGGGLTSGPAAVSWSSGRLDVFVRGGDNALWHKWYANGWSGWESLGGVLTSDPAVASWSPGRLDVFVRGGDNALWHKWYG